MPPEATVAQSKAAPFAAEDRKSMGPMLAVTLLVLLAVVGVAGVVLFEAGLFDRTPPSVKATPVGGNLKVDSGKELVLTIDVTDDKGLDAVEVELDGTLVQGFTPNGDRSLLKDVKLSSSDSGKHAVRINARDKRGNATTKALTITVAETENPPTETSSLPAGHPDISGVPATPSETASDYVSRHYKAILAQDWLTAWNLLPEDKKSGLTAEEFGEQVSAYGVTGYKIDDESGSGDRRQVSAILSTSGGDFGYLWTLEKQDDGNWKALSRTLSGMK